MNRYTLWIICASATLSVMAGSIIAPVINSIRDALNVAPSWAGLIITTHGLLVVVSSPFIGKFIDKFGTKPVFGLGLLLYGIAGGSGILINTYWLLILSRGFLGLAVSAIMTSITVIILDLYKGAERNRIMGIRASSQSFGAVIWPFLGGIIGVYSWHLPFSIYTIAIPLCVATLFTIPKIHHEKEKGSDLHYSVLNMLKDQPLYIAIYAMFFLMNVVLYIMVIYIPPLLETIGVVTSIFIGSLLAIYGLAAGITSLFYKHIKGKFSYRMIIIYVFLLWIAGTFIIWRAQSSAVIIGGLVILGHGAGVLNPTLNLWLGDIAPTAFRGRMVSYLSSSGLLGQFITPIMFAPVVPSVGYRGVFIISSAICAIILLLYYLTVLKRID